MSCMKDQLYGNSICTQSSCQKEYFTVDMCNNSEEKHRELQKAR